MTLMTCLATEHLTQIHAWSLNFDLIILQELGWVKHAL